MINTRCLNTPTLDKIKEKLLFYFTHTDNSRIKDPNTLWLEIKSGIIYCRDNIAKLKKFNVKPENKTPWFDKALIKLRRTRDNLYQLALDDFKLTNNMKSFAWLKFASIRNLFKSKFRQAKAL